MLYVECVTFALCSLTLVECSRMSRTMQNGALSKQYRNDVNKIDRPNTTPTVRAICTFASTRLCFYYIITKIHPPFENPGSAPAMNLSHMLAQREQKLSMYMSDHVNKTQLDIVYSYPIVYALFSCQSDLSPAKVTSKDCICISKSE